MIAPRDITVVGAGVVGMACACRLLGDGHRVRVIDPLPPGHGCSWGNAGVFASDAVLPLASPSTLAAVPGMLLRRDAPMTLRWQYLPGLLPWLLRFMANARPARVAANTRALSALCAAADAETRALLAGRAAGDLVERTGWLSVYETERGFTAGRREAAARERCGIRQRVLGGAEVRGLLVDIAPHVVGGVRSPDCAMCRDPAGLVRGLAADFVAAGGRIGQVRAKYVSCDGDRATIRTDGGLIEAEEVVLAPGIEINELAAGLGERFPVDTERGYHAMLPHAGIAPPMPVMAGEHKFVTTAMDHGVRLAGLTELGGRRLAPDWSRVEAILGHGRRLFPRLDTADAGYWIGMRSTLPDSLPVIGRSPGAPRVHYAFGHQHLGLTLAGLTARLIADDIADRPPVIDVHPLRPSRWLRRTG